MAVVAAGVHSPAHRITFTAAVGAQVSQDLGPRQMLRDLARGHRLYVMTWSVLNRCHDPVCDVCGVPLEVGELSSA